MTSCTVVKAQANSQAQNDDSEMARNTPNSTHARRARRNLIALPSDALLMCSLLMCSLLMCSPNPSAKVV